MAVNTTGRGGAGRPECTPPAVRRGRMARLTACTATCLALACQTTGNTGSPGLNRPVVHEACTLDHGGVMRGPRDARRLALIFTGGDYGEGAETILDALRERGVPAAFFLTGGFLDAPGNAPAIRRMVAEGHDLGPHSDAHLLYCPWEDRSRTLVTRDEFRRDLLENLRKLHRFGADPAKFGFFVPPYEWYNRQIVDWCSQLGLTVISFTPGTRCQADWAPEGHRAFVSSAGIAETVLTYESSRPDGLNGFLLLMHLGSGPGRTDKFHSHVGPLIDALAARGYRFVRVGQLLAGQP